jgi:tetratricopeptide (TPR) repeat protein
MTADVPKNVPEKEDEPLIVGGIRLSPGDRIGHYVYDRVIGRGGMATVLLARDPENRQVALKVLKASRLDTGQTRFRREFRALTRISHPNVIRVECFGDLHGHPYIAMEFVDGTDLHNLIRSFKNLPPDERWHQCERLLVDLARALAHVHRKGLVHRDLKPSNILIDRQSRAKLTDFGIVKNLDPSADPNISNTLVGTWAYASPEQIAGDPVDHRSDLYSLGVILFAMLTSRRPFVAKDLSGYLELHREGKVPRPRDVDPAVPEHLDDICYRLLQKTPRDRFQSAQEILFKMENLGPEAQALSTAVWQPPLVGRRREINVLQDRIAALTRGEGGALWILGPLGSGRTRLLETAADMARSMGFPIHPFRMRESGGSMGALQRLVEEIARDLDARFVLDLQSLLALFTQDEGRKRGDLRYRFYDAFKKAVEKLLAYGPRVIVVDDLHASEGPELDLLFFLLRTLVAGGAPLLVLGTARTDLASLVIDQLRDRAVLGLEPWILEPGPLEAQDILSLVKSFLGDAQGTTALAERLDRETEGNPLFLIQFLESLQARQTIIRTPGGYALAIDEEEIRSGHLDIPQEIRVVLGARLAELPAPQRRMLECLAVNGREMDLDVLLDVFVEESEDVVLDRVDRLVDQGIIQEHRVGSATYVDFSHGKIGDILYREMSPDRRMRLHHRMALVFEERSVGSVVAAEVIGEHYRRAGESGKAFQHLTVAARRLHERSLSAEAWELTERAQGVEDLARLDLPADTFLRTRRILLAVRGDILFGRGEWDLARKLQEDTLTLAEQLGMELEVGHARLALGTTERHMGHADRARALQEEALALGRRLGDRELVTEALQNLSAIAWDQGDLESCMRLAGEGLVLAVGNDLAGPRARLLLAQTAVQACQGHMASATIGLAEAEAILHELGMKRSRCLALTNLAEFHSWQANFARAWQCAVDALQLARGIRFRMAEGIALRVSGEIALELGRPDQARERLEAALEILSGLKVNTEIIATRSSIGRLELEQKRYDVARRHLSVARGMAALRDPESYLPLVQARLAEVFLHADDPFQAENILEKVLRARPGIALPRQIQSQCVAAALLVRLHRPDDAVAVARAAAIQAHGRGLRIWAFEALSLLSEHVVDGEERAHFRHDALSLFSAIVNDLPEDFAASFKQRTGMA